MYALVFPSPGRTSIVFLTRRDTRKRLPLMAGLILATAKRGASILGGYSKTGYFYYV